MVTGGCGFIGTCFIRYLLLESDFSGHIINVDKLTYAGNPENLADIQKSIPGRYTFIKADICDPDAMNRVFESHEIDTICNFAAESHVDRSIVAPDAFIKTNIEGTFNLLEAARRNSDIKVFCVNNFTYTVRWARKVFLPSRPPIIPTARMRHPRPPRIILSGPTAKPMRCR